MLVWMDLEMTGLDPASDTIVEIATIVTDDDLTVVAEGPDLVVHQPAEALAAMSDVVRDMHTRSGLLKAIESSTLSLADAGAETLAFIKQHVPEPRSVPLAGNSIGTDRRFLAAHLPEIEDHLHYRCIERISTHSAHDSGVGRNLSPASIADWNGRKSRQGGAAKIT